MVICLVWLKLHSLIIMIPLHWKPLVLLTCVKQKHFQKMLSVKQRLLTVIMMIKGHSGTLWDVWEDQKVKIIQSHMLLIILIKYQMLRLAFKLITSRSRSSNGKVSFVKHRRVTIVDLLWPVEQALARPMDKLYIKNNSSFRLQWSYQGRTCLMTW